MNCFCCTGLVFVLETPSYVIETNLFHKILLPVYIIMIIIIVIMAYFVHIIYGLDMYVQSKRYRRL